MNTTTYDNREAWKAARLLSIGSSDAVNICSAVLAECGKTTYGTELTVWCAKRGIKVPSKYDPSREERLWLGHEFEPLIAKRFAMIHNVVVSDPGDFTIVRSDEYPWMTATLDRTFLLDRGEEMALIEMKALEIYDASEWEDGEIPLGINIQVQHQLAVTGLRVAYVAMFSKARMIDGSRFVFRRVDRDQDHIDALIATEKRFWQHVIDGTQPEIDGSDHTKRALQALYPRDTGATVPLPFGFEEKDARRVDIMAEIKALEAEKDEIGNEIRAAIGDNMHGTLPNAQYTWKVSTKRATYAIIASDDAQPEDMAGALVGIKGCLSVFPQITLETTPEKQIKRLTRKKLKH